MKEKKPSEYTHDELVALILENNRMLHELLGSRKGEDLLTITDIANLTGYSRTTIYSTRKYLIPFFGERWDSTRGVKRWYRSTVEEWLSKGEKALEEEYILWCESKKKGY